MGSKGRNDRRGHALVLLTGAAALALGAAACAQNPRPVSDPDAAQVATLSAAPLPEQQSEQTVEALKRVGVRVRQFEKAFTYVICDETYRQHEVKHFTQEDRELRSEMLFMWVPGDQVWLGARYVHTVDGKPVSDSYQRIEEALKVKGEDVAQRLRHLRDESARFNLGDIYRNFSDPTFVLLFLDPAYQDRFRFSVVGTETIAGESAQKVAFEEFARPTLITAGPTNIFSKGFVWVKEDDGTVLKTQLNLVVDATFNRAAPPMIRTSTPTGPQMTSFSGMGVASLTASIVVDYQFDPRLELWVPARMSERYDQTRPERNISGVATYTNFRRFETSVGVIMPQ